MSKECDQECMHLDYAISTISVSSVWRLTIEQTGDVRKSPSNTTPATSGECCAISKDLSSW